MATEQKLFNELKRIADVLERSVPPSPPPLDWSAVAFRWRRHPQHGYLEAVTHRSSIRLDDLHNIDHQKQQITANTWQFVNGFSANNVLLTGSRGTGKSSLIKALLNAFADEGLLMIEVDKEQLIDLPEILSLIRARKERFILFCDDLSFSDNDPSYRALKVALDGSLHAGADNVLIYATSNRRHLIPEYMRENLDTHHEDGEICPSDTVEEKISLSERFGLWLSFYPNTQDQYLCTAEHWVHELGASWGKDARAEALRWALTRGNRSGRSAWQFARDWAGREALRASQPR